MSEYLPELKFSRRSVKVESDLSNYATKAGLTNATGVDKSKGVNKITTHDDHDKYITTQKFNKLTSEDSTARLAKAHLASKNDRS